jgi:hypothetical protein
MHMMIAKNSWYPVGLGKVDANPDCSELQNRKGVLSWCGVSQLPQHNFARRRRAGRVARGCERSEPPLVDCAENRTQAVRVARSCCHRPRGAPRALPLASNCQMPSIFPTWTSRVRSPSPALSYQPGTSVLVSTPPLLSPHSGKVTNLSANQSRCGQLASCADPVLVIASGFVLPTTGKTSGRRGMRFSDRCCNSSADAHSCCLWPELHQ